jgi:hypothetical protein
MRLTARFYVRGGVFTTVVAEHRQSRLDASADGATRRFRQPVQHPWLKS